MSTGPGFSPTLYSRGSLDWHVKVWAGCPNGSSLERCVYRSRSVTNGHQWREKDNIRDYGHNAADP